MKVTIYSASLFSWWERGHLITGGLERYVRALARLIRSLGWQVEIYQWAYYSEKRTYEGFPVTIVNCRDRDINSMVREMHQNTGPHIIYAWLGTQTEYKPGNITISHGVWWDWDSHDESVVTGIRHYITSALSSCRAVVSVDTNFVNWIKATLPGERKNLYYIPNFVDRQLFQEAPPNPGHDLVILYPRRMTPERGIEVTMAAADRILPRIPGSRFVFAGVGNPTMAIYQQFLHWWQNHPHRSRIEHSEVPYDAMPAVYQRADIVLVPSPFCEGTSLSCLEAMSCGRPVVTTTAGGLANLIIDGFNGLVFRYGSDQLVRAIELLAANASLRHQLGRNAAATAQAFSLGVWEQRWADLLYDVYIKKH